MKLFPLFILLLSALNINAQQYCYLTSEANSEQKKYLFSFSNKQENETHYVTDYLLKDETGKPVKLIKITNRQISRIIHISIKEANTGKTEQEYTCNYSEKAGLIINELTDSVVELTKPYEYQYLLSFENEGKKYITLHFVQKVLNNGYSILFNSVSDELLEKNKNYFRQLILYYKKLEEKKEKEAQLKTIDSLVELRVAEKMKELGEKPVVIENKQLETNTLVQQEVVEEKKDFNSILIKEAKDFFQLYKADSLFIVGQKNIINDYVQSKSYEGAKFSLLSSGYGQYAGEKGPMGVPNGKGILMQSSNVYLGNFSNGAFISGFVIIRESVSEYIGEYKNTVRQGRGWLKNQVGSFLGYFGNDDFKVGTVTIKKFENYFGRKNNSYKTGYGELRDKSGTTYYGLFVNDSFMQGYKTEVNNYGGIKYYKVENGISSPCLPDTGKSFFDALNELKK